MDTTGGMFVINTDGTSHYYLRAAATNAPKGCSCEKGTHNKERRQLVYVLAKHPHCTFTRAELEAKPLDELERLDQMARGTTPGHVVLGFKVANWWEKDGVEKALDPVLGFKVRDPWNE